MGGERSSKAQARLVERITVVEQFSWTFLSLTFRQARNAFTHSIVKPSFCRIYVKVAIRRLPSIFGSSAKSTVTADRSSS